MGDRQESSKAYEDQAFEATRLGFYIPGDPALEARNGGASFAGAWHIARSTLRSTWAVLSYVLRYDADEAV